MFQLRVLVAVLAIALCSPPAAAFERLVITKAGTTLVTPVADLDASPPRMRHDRGAGSYGRWRYRAAYTRWLHNEYVRAGYPIGPRRLRTYVRVAPCCCCGDRWD